MIREVVASRPVQMDAMVRMIMPAILMQFTKNSNLSVSAFWGTRGLEYLPMYIARSTPLHKRLFLCKSGLGLEKRTGRSWIRRF